MNIAQIRKFIGQKCSEDTRKKAVQYLKGAPVAYCYFDGAGALRAALRNSQSDGKKRLLRISLAENEAGELAARCPDCPDANPCVHAAALAMHCARFESFFSERRSRQDFFTDSGLPPVDFLSVSKQASACSGGARLEIHFPSGVPHFPTRWDKCAIAVKLFSSVREYVGNMSNLKQLHFKDMIGANLRISQFSLQERQIIRFLALNLDSDGNILRANSESLSELFHCLPDFPAIFSGERVLHVNRMPAEPAIALNQAPSGRQVFRPALLDSSGRVVAAKDYGIIMGRCGCWIGAGGDYWWIPGTADISLIRAFFRLEETSLDSNEAMALISQFPQKYFRVIQSAPKMIRRKKFVPSYQIRPPDSSRKELELMLYFDYDGVILKPGAENTHSSGGDKSFRRDKEAETQVLEELLMFGFARRGSDANSFILEDPEQTGVFLDAVLPLWRAESRKILFETTNFKPGGELRAALRRISENSDETRFGLSFALQDGKKGPAWTELLNSCRSGDEYMSISGGFYRVSEKLKDFVLSTWDIVKAKRNSSGGEDLLIPRAACEYFTSKAASCTVSIEGMPPSPPQEDNPKNVDLAVSKSFRGELREYQKDAIRWMLRMLKRRFNFILADEMGLGKTVQALALLSRFRELEQTMLPSLIICPSSLVENWKLEAERFTPDFRTAIVRGEDRDESFWEKSDSHDLLICSYTIMRRDIEKCLPSMFNCLILDEAQHIKNPGTDNAMSCKRINSLHRIVLTGTPLENSPMDLWSIFDFLHPGLLGTQQSFKGKFCSDDSSAAQNELPARTGPFMMRRKKAHVAPEIPEKTEHVVFCDFEPSQARAYEELLQKGREEFRAMASGDKSRRMNVLTCLLRLRQICCHPLLLPEEMRPSDCKSAKMELLRELVLESIDSGHRTLFFSQFTSLLKIVREWLDSVGISYEYLDGGTIDRMDRVKSFNSNPDIPLFLLSLKAGGYGLNLPSADRVIVYDPWWNPAVENQAADRTHRIGQTKKVDIAKLAVKGSVEERVLELHGRKNELFDRLVENSSAFRRIGDEEMEFLLSASEPS